MKDMRGASMKFYNDKLSARESDAVHLADLEALDFGIFGELHILCTMNALSKVGDIGNGVSSSNNQDSTLKNTRKMKGEKTINEEAKGE